MASEPVEAAARTALAGGVASRIPVLLKDQTFRRYWSGQTISLFGDEISMMALPLVAVLTLHASAEQMGWLTAAGLLPSLLFSLHAGAWVDRRGDRRKVMIAADIGRALLIGGVSVLYISDALTLGQLYAMAFGVGILSVAFEVSHTTLFVSLVPRAHYVQGNSLIHGSRAMSLVTGPSIAGALIQFIAAPLALLVDAVSFLASAMFLSKITPVEPPAAREQTGVSTGVCFIARSPVLRPVLAAATTLNLFNYMFGALFVLYATTRLGITPGLLGAVLGSAAVGAVLGALLTSRVVRRLGIGRVTLWSFVMFPAPLVLVPFAAGPTWLVAGLLFVAEFAASLAVMVLDIALASLFAAVIPDDMRSQVGGAFRVVNYGVRPLGSVLGGTLGGALGLRPTLWIATVGAVLNVLWLFPSPVPGLSDLPTAEGAGGG